MPIRYNRVVNKQVTLCMAADNEPVGWQLFLLGLGRTTPLLFLIGRTWERRLLVELNDLAILAIQRPQVTPHIFVILALVQPLGQRGVIELRCHLSVVLWGLRGCWSTRYILRVFPGSSLGCGVGECLDGLFVIVYGGALDAL